MRIFTLLLLLSCAPCLHAENEIMAPGAQVRKLAGGFLFTEGAACDAAGNVYFTDQPNDRIMKWATDGTLSTFLHPAGRANGLCFDPHGDLWACADANNQLWRIGADGKAETVLKDYQGKRFNGPNDLWMRPDGGIYFTDPFYKRPYWDHAASEQDGECVYFLSPDRKQLVRVAADLSQPNGIIGTPDGKLLYVADIRAGKTYRYRIQPDGSLQDKTLFCEMGSDGMTIDDQGDIYLTGNGVFVFGPAGQRLARIDLPEPGWVGNVCFGGKDRHTLFIAASKNLFALDMKVTGVGSQ